MRKASMRAECYFALLLGVAANAQEVPAILHVEYENQVRYAEDVIDPLRVARSSVPVTANPALNFGRNVDISDVTAVNGSPAKGVIVNMLSAMLLSPTPAPGQSISDVSQGQFGFFQIDILKPNGDRIGSIFAIGGPGTPTGAAIIGGSGAYVGARGTLNGEAVTGGRPPRNTSQAEDPSMRRTNGVAGRSGYVLRVFPMFRPEVLVGQNGPVIVHEDYSAITSAKPARSGEVLILYAKGLGPTTPSVNPGDLFPGAPFAVVNSPLEVLVNGKAAPAINQIGLPATSDIYHIAFRVPEGTAAGSATVQISAAWVKGSAVGIPVR